MIHRVIDSPLGPLTLVFSPDGALAALYTAGQKHLPDPAALGERDDTAGDDVVRQLGEYFEGSRSEFDVPLAPTGTEFQRRVWDALRTIPAGQTRSYGELAAQIGMPGAARAVGSATGRNPISIIVPCHRLVGASGQLVGYAGGVDRKRWLLAHERDLAAD